MSKSSSTSEHATTYFLSPLLTPRRVTGSQHPVYATPSEIPHVLLEFTGVGHHVGARTLVDGKHASTTYALPAGVCIPRCRAQASGEAYNVVNEITSELGAYLERAPTRGQRFPTSPARDREDVETAGVRYVTTFSKRKGARGSQSLPKCRTSPRQLPSLANVKRSR
ncbi:hypothetical protein FA13DRAFT_1716161 [Coprinellus micaceus]|uniref:Uncharacterized protein n=1 Tax=Coprinellus micaceus TaxID=71717 RepID=A0A4Y7SKD9_COPMI|nr:hypothetical protein FA13DRAFT_1716161 [Coprinellus micaceus]